MTITISRELHCLSHRLTGIKKKEVAMFEFKNRDGNTERNDTSTSYVLVISVVQVFPCAGSAFVGKIAQ